MYQPLITFCPHPAIFTQVLSIFEINLLDTFARSEKYQSKLCISRSLTRILAKIHIYCDILFVNEVKNYQRINNYQRKMLTLQNVKYMRRQT